MIFLEIPGLSCEPLKAFIPYLLSSRSPRTFSTFQKNGYRITEYAEYLKIQGGMGRVLLALETRAHVATKFDRARTCYENALTLECYGWAEVLAGR